MKKRLVSVLVTAAMVFALTGCGGKESSSEPAAPAGDAAEETEEAEAAEETGGSAVEEAADAVHLTLAHADTETGSLFGECMTEFKNMVEEKSGGSVIIDIYPNGQLGTVAEYVVAIQSGTIDFAPAASTFVANFCEDVAVFDMPFLFEDYDHVWEALDGEVGDTLTASLQENGIEPLVWWGLGFRNVTTSESHMINSIDDLKGFRIRVMTSAIHQALFQALGSDAVPMDWGELYTALQQGTVDGQENPFSQTLSSNIWEVNPVIVKTEHAFTPSVFMMSPAVADKVSEEQMNIIRECAEECKDIFRDRSVSINEEALDTLMNEKGCTYVETIEKADLQAATESVYDQFPEYADLVAIIRGLR